MVVEEINLLEATCSPLDCKSAERVEAIKLESLFDLLLLTTKMSSTALTKALPSALKEVRFHLCQTGPASAGAR